MAITQVYVDPAINANSGTGTIGDPYGDLQYALNTKVRDAVNGDQFNIKAGTAEVLAAPLTLATYGTPTQPAYLVLRGYTTAANDGGIAEINCNGASMWTVTTYDFVGLVDLKIHNGGNNNLVNLDTNCFFVNCEFYPGVSTPVSKTLLSVGGIDGLIAHCYFHDPGTTGFGLQIVGGRTVVVNNFIDAGTSTMTNGISIGTAPGAVVIGNIIRLNSTGTGIGISATRGGTSIIGNTIYNAAAGTGSGINFSGSTYCASIAMNNVVEGFSGVGGVGIKGTGSIMFLGHNATYNCATPVSVSEITHVDKTAYDVLLGASPFTSPAGANYAVSTALKALGFPSSFLGASTNTYVDIGAAQRQEPAGGAVSISPVLGAVGAA